MRKKDERNLTVHKPTMAKSYRGKLFEEKCIQKVMDVEIKSGALIDNEKYIHILSNVKLADEFQNAYNLANLRCGIGNTQFMAKPKDGVASFCSALTKRRLESIHCYNKNDQEKIRQQEKSYIFIISSAPKDSSSEAAAPWTIGAWSKTLRSEFERDCIIEIIGIERKEGAVLSDTHAADVMRQIKKLPKYASNSELKQLGVGKGSFFLSQREAKFPNRSVFWSQLLFERMMNFQSYDHISKNTILIEITAFLIDFDEYIKSSDEASIPENALDPDAPKYNPNITQLGWNYEKHRCQRWEKMADEHIDDSLFEDFCTECVEEIIALESETGEIVSFQTLIEMFDSVRNCDKFKNAKHLEGVNFHVLGRNLYSNRRTANLYDKLMKTRRKKMNIYKEKARDAINEPHSSYLRRKRNYKMIIEEGDVVREISGTHIEIIDSDKKELLEEPPSMPIEEKFFDQVFRLDGTVEVFEKPTQETEIPPEQMKLLEKKLENFKNIKLSSKACDKASSSSAKTNSSTPLEPFKIEKNELMNKDGEKEKVPQKIITNQCNQKGLEKPLTLTEINEIPKKSEDYVKRKVPPTLSEINYITKKTRDYVYEKVLEQQKELRKERLEKKRIDNEARKNDRKKISMARPAQNKIQPMSFDFGKIASGTPPAKKKIRVIMPNMNSPVLGASNTLVINAEDVQVKNILEAKPRAPEPPKPRVMRKLDNLKAIFGKIIENMEKISEDEQDWFRLYIFKHR